MSLELALSAQPQDNDIAFSLAQLHLLRGDWPSAWPLYERRDQLVVPAYQPLPYPRWNGEAAGNYRLVVVTERNFGEAIMFGRFARLLAQQGYHVTILTHPTLAPVLAGLPGIEQVVTSEDEMAVDPLPIRWVPLNSLAAIHRLTVGAVPRTASYIGVDPARAEAWKSRLGPGLKVGLAWQAPSAGRSVPLTALAPLAEIPGVRLIALQRNPGAEQLGVVSFGDRFEWPIERDDDDPDALIDTAALLINLDAVVTCDGIMAHLAGALGRPTFLALRPVSDWPWLLNRDDSPWYPAMRLFRQRTRDDWNGVIERIAQTLRTQLRS